MAWLPLYLWDALYFFPCIVAVTETVCGKEEGCPACVCLVQSSEVTLTTDFI